MIIHTTNTLLAPLVALAVGLIWALNLFLIAATVRLLAGWIRGELADRVVLGLAPITDSLPEALAHRLTAWWGCAVPMWVAWLGVIVGVILTQQLLVALVLAFA